jgi:hypothetical protein
MIGQWCAPSVLRCALLILIVFLRAASPRSVQCTDAARAEVEAELAAEQAQHGDLARLTFPERYENLLDKTVETFRWAADSFRFDYLLKIDDDTLMRLDLLYPALLNRFDYSFTHATTIVRDSIVRERFPDRRPPAASAAAPAGGAAVVAEGSVAGDKLYIGRIYTGSPIVRDPNNKNWQPRPEESEHGYADSEHYLPYAAGPGPLCARVCDVLLCWCS